MLSLFILPLSDKLTKIHARNLWNKGSGSRKTAINRASDGSWRKKSNFARFLGTNSQKNQREISGQTLPKSNQ